MAGTKGFKYLDKDKEYLHGAVRIKDTRFSVYMISRDIRAGSTPQELVEIFPELSIEANTRGNRIFAKVW